MTCFFFKTLISHSLDGDRPLSRRVRRHVDSCPSCAGFLRTSRALHSRLESDPSPERLPSPDAVAARVMAAISRPEDREPKPVARFGKRGAFWKRSSAAALVACLVVALSVEFFSIDSGSGRPPTREDISAGVDVFFELGQKLIDSDGAGGRRIPCLANVARPFTVEVSRLTSNAESVKGFFISFMPAVKTEKRANPDRVGK